MRQAGGKDRAVAKLVKAYRAATGYSLRTAQRHASGDHHEWRAFIQGQAIAAGSIQSGPASESETAALSALSPNRPPDRSPIDASRPDSELSEPEKVLRATYNMWAWSFKQWTLAYRSDVQGALIHMSATLKCREAYNEALKDHTAWQIQQRLLIPADEFTAFRAEFVLPLATVLGNMENELPPEVNPHNPAQARVAIARYLRERLAPVIETLINNLDLYDAPTTKAAS